MPAPYPAIRWHGSKWRVADWIISHFPEHHLYVEPYGGGASVLLKKAPSPAEVYNDLNSALYNFFKVLRERKEDLCRAVYYTPMSRQEYLHSWSARDEVVDPVERARMLVVAAYQARGSIVDRETPTGWRIFAKKSDFGQHPAEQWATVATRLEWVAERLRKVFIENKPATEVIRSQDSDSTLFYCDPPYQKETLADQTRNYACAMDEAGHRELIETLRDCRGMVALSGYDNDLYETQLPGWTKLRTAARAEQNVKRTEVLWLNPALAKASPSLNRGATAGQAMLFGDTIDTSLRQGTPLQRLA